MSAISGESDTKISEWYLANMRNRDLINEFALIEEKEQWAIRELPFCHKLWLACLVFSGYEEMFVVFERLMPDEWNTRVQKRIKKDRYMLEPMQQLFKKLVSL
jgi:hypothetical protein